jgi:hypothetical protein
MVEQHVRDHAPDDRQRQGGHGKNLAVYFSVRCDQREASHLANRRFGDITLCGTAGDIDVYDTNRTNSTQVDLQLQRANDQVDLSPPFHPIGWRA